MTHQVTTKTEVIPELFFFSFKPNTKEDPVFHTATSMLKKWEHVVKHNNDVLNDKFSDGLRYQFVKKAIIFEIACYLKTMEFLRTSDRNSPSGDDLMDEAYLAHQDIENYLTKGRRLNRPDSFSLDFPNECLNSQYGKIGVKALINSKVYDRSTLVLGNWVRIRKPLDEFDRIPIVSARGISVVFKLMKDKKSEYLMIPAYWTGFMLREILMCFLNMKQKEADELLALGFNILFQHISKPDVLRKHFENQFDPSEAGYYFYSEYLARLSFLKELTIGKKNIQTIRKRIHDRIWLTIKKKSKITNVFGLKYTGGIQVEPDDVDRIKEMYFESRKKYYWRLLYDSKRMDYPTESEFFDLGMRTGEIWDGLL